MAINLLDMIKDQVGDSVLSQAGKFLGESDSGVKSAMGAALPSILGSLITKGGSGNGAGAILDMISSGNHNGSIFDNLGGLLGGGDATSGFLNSGSGILKSLLGNKLGSVVDIIASVSGMKKGSSSSIMSMAAPMVMGMLGKYVKNKALDAAGLGKFLGTQSPHVASALPAGMGSLLGFGKQSIPSANTGGTRVTETSHSAPTGGSSGGGGGFMKKVLPILGLLLLGWAGWNFLLKDSAVGDLASSATGAVTDVAGGAVDAVGGAAGAAAGAVGDVAGAAGNAAGAMVDGAKDAAGAVGDAAAGAAGAVGDAAGSMVDGAKGAAGAVGDAAGAALSAASAAAAKALEGVKFATGSVGEKFSSYLSTGKGDGSFSFNNMKFATGSANIDAGSMSEVDNLAKVLNAYSNVGIEVGGHTDNTGNAANNTKLSDARAAAVKARLVAQGVAAGRISTKGYGSAAPTASNDTAEGRAQNRRIEVKVTKK